MTLLINKHPFSVPRFWYDLAFVICPILWFSLLLVCGKRYKNPSGINYHKTHSHQDMDDMLEEQSQPSPLEPVEPRESNIHTKVNNKQFTLLTLVVFLLPPRLTGGLFLFKALFYVWFFITLAF